MYLGFWGRGRKRREELKAKAEAEAKAKKEAEDKAAFEKWRREADQQRAHEQYMAALKVSSLDLRRQQMQSQLSQARIQQRQSYMRPASDYQQASSDTSIGFNEVETVLCDSSSSPSADSSCSSDSASSSSSSDSSSCGSSD